MKQIAAKLSRIGSAGFGDYQIRLGLKRRDFSMTVVKRRFRKLTVPPLRVTWPYSPDAEKWRFRADGHVASEHTAETIH